VIRERAGDDLRPGSTLYVDAVALHVREIVDGRIITVGLAIPDSPRP
jgi:hypothetical protein